MKPTIYDVAKEAGVSIATVSKVINNIGNMRASTREKVKAAILKLDYRPNLMASALTGKSTETLGLLVPDISNPFFSEMARTIEDYVHECSMSVIMCSTDENAEKERKYVELLLGKQVDGFIIASSFHDKSLLKELMKKRIPFVMFTQDNLGLHVASVSVDDFRGGYEATLHLLSKGHRNIVMISENANSSKMRIYGYQEALAEYGVDYNEDNIFRTTASIDNGRECMNEIAQKANVPTAIFACNDIIALGVIQGAKENGLKVPEDISIIGFDNTILATTTVPALTTVAQPIAEMGRKVVDVIIAEINGNNMSKERILFNPQLIVRGTTAEINPVKIHS